MFYVVSQKYKKNETLVLEWQCRRGLVWSYVLGLRLILCG
jgi:hypothetical protein